MNTKLLAVTQLLKGTMCLLYLFYAFYWQIIINSPTVSMLSNGCIFFISSGSISHCFALFHPCLAIWYLNSSARFGVVARRRLPHWWRPTSCNRNRNLLRKRGRRARERKEHENKINKQINIKQSPFLISFFCLFVYSFVCFV